LQKNEKEKRRTKGFFNQNFSGFVAHWSIIFINDWILLEKLNIKQFF